MTVAELFVAIKYWRGLLLHRLDRVPRGTSIRQERSLVPMNVPGSAFAA
jgi:hypothetical protein